MGQMFLSLYACMLGRNGTNFSMMNAVVHEDKWKWDLSLMHWYTLSFQS